MTLEDAAEVDGYQPDEKYIDVNDIRLCYFESRPDLAGIGPTLLFTHATGFHARCWDEIAENLRDFHVLAIDQRGHGQGYRLACPPATD